MKPFNLEEYRANPSKKVVTRDEREARIICTDRQYTNDDGINYPICALVKTNKKELSYSYTINGEFISGIEDIADLFFAPEKKEGWVNLLKDFNGDAFVGSPIIYETKENAEKDGKKSNKYIATVKIEWEE